MKQILPVLFLLVTFIIFPRSVLATISFTIDNPVREGDYFIVDTTLSGISSSSAFVQGVFTHTSSPNYFGFTWGQKEDWVSYQSTTTKDFISQNFPILLKDNPQKIWVKPDYLDSGYKGPGEYFLKLRRYTGASDGSAGDSNTLTVSLSEPTPSALETPSPTASPTSVPAETVTPTPTLTPTQTTTLNPTKTPTPTPLKTPTPTPVILANAGLRIPSGEIHPISPIPNQQPITNNSELASPSSVLGTSTNSGDIIPSPVGAGLIPPTTTSSSFESTPNNTSVLKYSFIFGAILSAGSGGWLYFRHKKD